MSDRTLSFAPHSPLSASSGASSLRVAANAGDKANPADTVNAGDTANAGVTAVLRDGLGLATVLARRGASGPLTQRVRERFGIGLPSGPRRSGLMDVAFAGTGPGTWLASAERGGNEFAEMLMGELDGLASVSDQSDGYVLIRLTGACVRETLAKLIPIDVHPRSFKVGDVASTVASHIGVTAWRLPDASNAADASNAGPVFEIVLFRSFTLSFWHALAEAAAEFGFEGQVP